MRATISKQCKRGAMLIAASLVLSCAALAAPPSHGVLAHLSAAQAKSFNAVLVSQSLGVYLAQPAQGQSDQDLLAALQQIDPNAELNTEASLAQSTASVLNGQSTASVLNQSTASVLNEQSTASVLNQSTASVLNGNVDFYGTKAPTAYTNQPAVGQIFAGPDANRIATGRGTVVALIDNGVDQFNPVLRKVVLWNEGYNFVDNNRDASAWSDLGQSTASVLNQSTASVLNEQSTASVLNGQSTASVLNGQSTASVLNGQSTASVLNGQSTASVLNAIEALLAQSTASVLNGQSTASVLNQLIAELGQSTASVLNGCADGQLLQQSTASVLNQSTASVLNGQSTASVLNALYVVYLRQSTASVLNQSTASVLNGDLFQQLLLKLIGNILSCDPDFGHGTAVAGLIHLVAPEAKILPIKAFGADGTADTATIVSSIDYAISRHVDVINMSFSADGSGGPDPLEQQAVQAALDHGIIVVAAAGNESSSAPVYPAAQPGVVGVGSAAGCTITTTTNPDGSQTITCPALPSLVFAKDFSNFDPGPGQFVDDQVGAPGVWLYTTFPGFGLIWANSTGTSFSTPLVAGEAALLVQEGLTGNANRSVIFNNNQGMLANQHGELGYGVVNVAGAVQSAPHGSHHGGHDPDSGRGRGW